MKLRNKKTGDIVRVEFLNNYQTDDGTEIGFRVANTLNVYSYTSLAELNEEWCDYEEPKEYWYIYADKPQKANCGDILEEDFKAIGNYFETEEEAEQAVEKLKAFKRLKDKGLTFCTWKISDDGCSVDIETTLDAEVIRAQQKHITDDLNLLFGGEE